MSLSTIVSDVVGYAADAEKLLTSAVPVVGEVEQTVVALGAVAKMFTSFQAYLQTPEMVNASSAQKLQAFKDRVSNDLATGDEADLEKLEAQ